MPFKLWRWTLCINLLAERLCLCYCLSVLCLILAFRHILIFICGGAVSNVPMGGTRESIYCTSSVPLANGPTSLCPLTPSQKNISTSSAQSQPVSGFNCLPQRMFSPPGMNTRQADHRVLERSQDGSKFFLYIIITHFFNHFITCLLLQIQWINVIVLQKLKSHFIREEIKM